MKKTGLNKERLQQLKTLMKDERLDAILLSTVREEFNANINYFTDFCGNAFFILKKRSVPVLGVSPIDIEKAKKSNCRAILILPDNRKEKMSLLLRGAKRIGIDKQNMLVSQLDEAAASLKMLRAKFEFVDVGRKILSIRAEKDEQEIKLIMKACSAADAIIADVIRNFKFRTERELSDYLEIRAKQLGYSTSFNPIVASAKNASDVHHIPSGKIRKGFLIIDFGLKAGGYCSDMTRTIYVGTPSGQELETYEFVLSCQKKLVAMAKPGMSGSAMHNTAKNILGKRFVHGLGHGVGLQIHEMPFMSKNTKDVLAKNSVVTIEPGIYEEGKFGIRIEDTVLITKDSNKVLTLTPKKLICVRTK